MEKYICYLYSNSDEFYFIQKYLINKGYKDGYYGQNNIIDFNSFPNNLNCYILANENNKFYTVNDKNYDKFKLNKHIPVKYLMRQQKLNKLYK